jgi:hypothetical protein
MQQVSPAFGSLAQLAQAFTQMIRKRQPEQLDLWLEQANTSEFPELISFASGIKRDYAAVKAALHSPYSTGPVEGNINRLKLIKRSRVFPTWRGCLASRTYVRAPLQQLEMIDPTLLRLEPLAHMFDPT